MEKLDKLKSSAVQSATYDTILKIALRVVSFILNSIIVRNIGAATFAICSVKLLLLYSTTFLLTREAFRRASLAAKQNQINYKLINLIWLGTTTIVPVGVLLSYVWCYLMETPPEETMKNPTHYPYCVAIMLASCTVELFSEVPFIIAELQLWSKTRVLIEGVTQLTRSALIAAVVIFIPSNAVLGYCISHLIGSFVFTLSYYFVFYRAMKDKNTITKMPFVSMRQLLPFFTNYKKFEVNTSLASTCRGFMLQSWLKQLLTEGEWYLMNFLPLVSLTQQGNYQVVTNLGSLGARLILRSIEDAAYKFFGQTLQRDVPLTQQNKERVKEASDSLEVLLKYLLIFGLTVICFGWGYSSTILFLYGGNQFSIDSTSLMRAECLLMAFLAVNGITEAYTFAAMSKEHLNGHNRLLLPFSLVYIVLCALFSYIFGAVGFAVANCINMSLRITHGWLFIHNQYKGTGLNPLKSLYPSSTTMCSLAFAFLASILSEMFLYQRTIIGHLIFGLCAFILFLYMLRYECKMLYIAFLNKLDSNLAIPLVKKLTKVAHYVLYNKKYQ